MEINALTVYLALGLACALASWAEDYNNHEDRLTVWELVFIVCLGPVFAVFELVALVRQRVRKRNN
jgi:hypothetical protein